MELEQRININIEWVRIIAVVLITFTHTRHHFESGVYFFLFEQLPPIGTSLLSVVSGYLYITYSSKKDNLLLSKVKSLLIPYLIANLFVVILVLIANFGFGLDFLNRFEYNSILIFDGLLALNSPPINPPTYFIRDIFIIFSILSIIQNRNFLPLLYLIPLAYFGQMFLRWDVVFMFSVGCGLSFYRDFFFSKRILFSVVLFLLAFVLNYCDVISFNAIKFFLAPSLFLVVDFFKLKPINTGAYSYLTHLYHSPIIVCTYPVIALFIFDERVSVFIQVIIALFGAWLVYRLTRKIKTLRILCGFK